MTEEARPGGAYRVAWSVLLVISFLLVVIGLALMLLPNDAGIPLPADDRGNRLLGIVTVAVGVLSASIVWYGIREGSPLSVRIMWTLPVLAAGIAAVFLVGGDYIPAAVYTGMAALSAWMLAVAQRHLD